MKYGEVLEALVGEFCLAGRVAKITSWPLGSCDECGAFCTFSMFSHSTYGNGGPFLKLLGGEGIEIRCVCADRAACQARQRVAQERIEDIFVPAAEEQA